jgi:Cu+-exporting ATPase
LEAYSKGRTADAVTALGKLRPSTTLVLVPASLDAVEQPASPLGSDCDVEKGGMDAFTALGMRVQKMDAELLEVGDVVRILHGSTPPADGTVISPKGDATGGDVLTSFDESSLTGESKPVKKQAGDKVYLGTVNQGNVVDVRVDSVGGESMYVTPPCIPTIFADIFALTRLDHIVRIVREGQTKRAPIERVADMVTAYFVPVITLIAVLTWVTWLALGYGGALPKDYLDSDVGGWGAYDTSSHWCDRD